jgi:lipopolysaccharide transport system permease protein
MVEGVRNRSDMKMVIQPSAMPLGDKAAEYRHYGTLFWFLARRDIQLRYRQTLLGIAWAVLQPLLPMLIFVAVFARLLRMETGEIPYPLFVLSGLAPWTFVASAVTAAGPTFINNYSLLNKVYFPRAILPAATVGAAALDGLVGIVVVLLATLWYGFAPLLPWLLIPVVSALTVLLAVAAGLAVASITAVFRDMKNVVPFLVQLWMYSTPVFYPAQLIPDSLQPLAGFNPMTGILEAFRCCLFGTAPNWTYLWQSAAGALILCATAVWLFHSLEADLAERV